MSSVTVEQLQQAYQTKKEAQTAFYNAKQKYLEENALYAKGEKVYIVDNGYWHGREKRTPVFVNSVHLYHSTDKGTFHIRYNFYQCKKDGTKSKVQYEYGFWKMQHRIEGAVTPDMLVDAMSKIFGDEDMKHYTDLCLKYGKQNAEYPINALVNVKGHHGTYWVANYVVSLDDKVPSITYIVNRVDTNADEKGQWFTNERLSDSAFVESDLSKSNQQIPRHAYKT